MTAESQQGLATHLARSPQAWVKGRPPSTLAVDWSILLAYNPPPGYRSTSRPAGYETPEKDEINPPASFDGNGTQKEDKVCVILRNILQQLEKEIKDEKNRLKEERRAKRKERAKRRDERLQSDVMTDDTQRASSRRLFRVVSSSASGLSKSVADDRIRRRMLELNELQRTNSLKLSNVRTCSLDRPDANDYRSNYRSWDWSRYSRESDDFDDVSMETTDSWDLLNVDDVNDDGDSDHTIENENSDTESVEISKDLDEPKTDDRILSGQVGARNKTTLVYEASANTSDCVQDTRTDTTGTPELNIRKQFPHFEVLPTLKRNMTDEHNDETESAGRSSSSRVSARSNSVDICVGLYNAGQDKYRSEKGIVIDEEEEKKDTRRYETSIENGAKLKETDCERIKTASIQNLPRKRSLNQRNNLVRQRPVNKIETLLVGEEENKDETVDNNEDKNIFADVVHSNNDVTVNGDDVDIRHVREVPPSGGRTVVPAWRRELKSPPILDVERSQSTGTSGYSTDECSVKVSTLTRLKMSPYFQCPFMC